MRFSVIFKKILFTCCLFGNENVIVFQYFMKARRDQVKYRTGIYVQRLLILSPQNTVCKTIYCSVLRYRSQRHYRHINNAIG